MLRYYKISPNQSITADNIPNSEVICKQPSPFDNFHYLIWSILSASKGGMKVFSLSVDGKIVSTLEVTPRLPYFCFMPKHKNVYQLGPAYTIRESRGKGYYPYLIKYVISFLNKECYMIVDENNKASIRGIEKSGFKLFAYGRKNRLGIYRIVSFVNEQVTY